MVMVVVLVMVLGVSVCVGSCDGSRVLQEQEEGVGVGSKTYDGAVGCDVLQACGTCR